DDRALQTRGRPDDAAAVDDRAARVRIRSGQREHAGAELGERAAPAHRSGIGPVGSLIEDHERVVQDVALKARGVADQRTARYRRPARVRIRTLKKKAAGADLHETAAAGNRSSERRVSAASTGRQRARAERERSGPGERRHGLAEAVEIER